MEPSSTIETDTTDKLSVVIGTYHCSVAQFDFDLEIGTCKRQWVDDSATKSIAAITFNGFFSIFGGNDELVRIVNVASNQNVGALHEHQGSITHLETFQNTHLFSSSDDGKIYIWEIGGGHKKNKVKNKKNMAKGWECLCCMHNMHKPKYSKQSMSEFAASPNSNAKILSFSIHPSGRLMISVDNKHELKIWNLIRAKCIVTIKMPKAALDVCWSPNGYTYAIVREHKVLIYNKEGVLYKVIKPVCRMIDNAFMDRYQASIVSFCYVTHDVICIADMSARIVIFDISTKTPLFRLSGHEQQQSNEEEEGVTTNSHPKIRNLKVCSLNENLYLISADNRGKICIWNVHDCLNRVIEINSSDAKMEKDENESESESDSEEEEDDYTVDENGMFTFAALMEVETDTMITCMDAGVVGKLNQMYKWKKPRVAYGASTDITHTLGDEDEINEDEKESESVSGQKRKFDEMVDESLNAKQDMVDSDDEEFRKIQRKKKRKKKKKKKKPAIDLSRFD